MLYAAKLVRLLLCAALLLGPTGCASLLAPLVQPAVDVALEKGGKGAQVAGDKLRESGRTTSEKGGALNWLWGGAQKIAGELLVIGGTIATGGTVYVKSRKKKLAKKDEKKRRADVLQRDVELAAARDEGARVAFAKKSGDLPSARLPPSAV